ncbi:MAG TPA: MFS transporter, partial [Anaerolineae bacterium]
SALDGPARQALVPSLVSREHLTNALSLNAAMGQAATVAGPMLAGLLIGGHSISIVYWINALSFLAVIGALLIMHPAAAAAASRKIDLSSVREGLSFVRRSSIISSTMLLDFFATFFSSANQLLPIFAAKILNVGPQGFGLLEAAPAIGAVITSGVMSWISRVRRPGAWILWSVAAYGLATVLFGLSTSFALSLICLGLTGVADTISMILRQLIRQLVTPDHIRGRMTSVNMIFFMGGPQLGEVEAGAVAALIGAPLSVVTGGLGCLLAVAFIAWKVPTLRRYDEDDLKRAGEALAFTAGK